LDFGCGRDSARTAAHRGLGRARLRRFHGHGVGCIGAGRRSVSWRSAARGTDGFGPMAGRGAGALGCARASREEREEERRCGQGVAAAARERRLGLGAMAPSWAPSGPIRIRVLFFFLFFSFLISKYLFK
jgi:hypothetical protein